MHLGSKASRSKDALKFIEKNSCERLILNGDIVDGWALKRGGKWKDSHTRFVKRVLKIAKKAEVIYVVGNHDDFLDKFRPLNLNQIRIVREYIMTDLRGRRLYVFHGDVLDVFSTSMRWLAVIGSVGYDIALWLNRLYNVYREWRNLPYYSISQAIKSRVKSALSFMSDFEKKAISLAESKGCEVAVCGHIHQAKLGDQYMNSGDWCESCSALVEKLDGTWEIQYFHALKP